MGKSSNDPCPQCGGTGEVICPRCRGNGKCCAESSTELTWDSGYTLDAIIKARDEHSRGYPFCFFGNCSACDGKGKSLFVKCRVCNGTGKCPICDGRDVCMICDGGGKSECGGCRGTGFIIGQ
jgi:DnaJ-class molecular chaperone